MADFREAVRIAVARVERDGMLSKAWTVDRAADWIWARSHITTWQHLVDERGWRRREFADHSVESLLNELVEPTAKKKKWA
jgi:hypothetical protein